MTERGLRRTAVVPRISLIKLWEWAGYQPHIVIGVDEYWQTESAARKLEREIYVDLEQRGLAEGRALTPRFKATLEVFAKAEAEVHGWVSDTRANENGGVLVAEYRDSAARLVCDDELVRIDPVPVGEVAEYTVQALPDVPSLYVEPFTVIRPPDEPGDKPYQVKVSNRSKPSDKARLKQLEKGPHTGVHQLYVVARAHGGHAMSEPLTVLDLVEGGRALVSTTRTEDGDLRLAGSSGTYENLVGQIQSTWHELLRGLTPART